MKQANANEALADGSGEGEERVGERRKEKERDINDTHFPHSANEIINKESLLHTLPLSFLQSLPLLVALSLTPSLNYAAPSEY